VGVDLEALVKGTVPEPLALRRPCVEKGGVTVGLQRPGEAKYVGGLTVGVFADERVAEAALKEHILHTSVGPDTDLAGRIGQQGVAWGGRRFVWRRDNAVVGLSLPPAMAEAVATAMDKALAAGLSGVRRGAEVPSPRIIEIKAPATMKGGSSVPVEVVIELPRPANGEFLGVADGYGASITPHAVDPSIPYRVRASYTMHFTANRVQKQEEMRRWVCYATRECVTAEAKLVTIGVLPE
jgi:hypothetical protein